MNSVPYSVPPFLAKQAECSCTLNEGVNPQIIPGIYRIEGFLYFLCALLLRMPPDLPWSRSFAPTKT